MSTGLVDPLHPNEKTLEYLREQHSELDREISRLVASGESDIRIMALKRLKLKIKDRISWLQDCAAPDIIA